MKHAGWLVVVFIGLVLGANASEKSSLSVGTEPPGPVPEGYMLHESQPNGWGKDPESAVKDLRERIFPMYQRVFGDRPGFTIDYYHYALVEISDGRQWQADGRIWWFTPTTKTQNKRVTVGRDRGLRTK